MKNSIVCLLLMLVMNSCNMSLYLNKKGVIDVPKKESYQVTYKTSLRPGIIAKISYTDESDRIQKVDNVTVDWEKSVTLKAGKHVKIKIVATGDVKVPTDFKVLVDGKIISEHTLNGKKSKFSFSFDLP